MTTETFAHIPLARIVASTTNPRKHFDQAKMAELAESIRASGVHQPVLVRPLPASRVADTTHMDPRPDYELVSGERRYRASEAAGLPTIPAMVRPLTDSEVLEIQVVENLQRDDLHPLEEAEGYERLMHAHEPPLTADQIGERIGKSRSYVYARLKLLNLCPEGQQAMRDGWLEPSTALLVARAPSSKLQIDILGNLKDWNDEPLSHREASALIQRQYMLRLSEARFKITDATLIPSAGSCKLCPKRTGADPDIFADVSGADVCTDPPCFKAKNEAHTEQALKTARESGANIIEGREAKALIPHSYTGRVEGYLRLDDAADSPTDKPLRKIIGKLLEEEGITPTLVADPHHGGELVAVVDHATASRLLAKKGHQDEAEAIDKRAQASEKEAERAQKAKDQERYEKAWRWEVLRAAWAKIRDKEDGMYSVPDTGIRAMARRLIPNNQEQCKRLCQLLELGTVAPSEAVHDWVRDHNDPDRALALLIMFSDIEWRTWGPEENQVNQQLLDIATDIAVGVDPQAIAAEVKKQHTAEIRARNKVQAEKAAAEAAKASTPLPPAAQAGGVRGGEKVTKGTKKSKAQAAPAAPRITPEEALQGIAAAMQGEGGGGGDCAPAGSDPVGASAEVAEGRATSPDASASPLVPGARVRFVGDAMTGQLGRLKEASSLHGEGLCVVTVDGLSGDYLIGLHEFEVVAEDAGVVAWPFPKVAA